MLSIIGYILSALLLVVTLFLILAALPFYSRETPSDAADTIERYLRGEVDDAEWDAFTSVRARDAIVKEAKQRTWEIIEAHSSDRPPTYLDEEGESLLRELAHSLRGDAA